jgi:N-succinyldiaminopimelate aminotransferase
MPFPRARRLDDIVGFGIDQVAAAADHPPDDRPVLRLENLDTDLPLPPEAIPETVLGLERPAANS